MATDLSDLSELEPAATDPVSSGDDEIRKSRLHTKNWANVEHHLTGEHEFPAGVAPPAAGKVNRIFIHTSHGDIRRDTGSAWVHLKSLGNSPLGFNASSLSLTTSYVTKISSGIDVPSGAGVLMLAQCQLNITTLGVTTQNIDFRILYGGSTILPSSISWNKSLVITDIISLWAVLDAPSTGNKTIEFQARKTDSTLVATTTQHSVTAFLL